MKLPSFHNKSMALTIWVSFCLPLRPIKLNSRNTKSFGMPSKAKAGRMESRMIEIQRLKTSEHSTNTSDERQFLRPSQTRNLCRSYLSKCQVLWHRHQNYPWLLRITIVWWMSMLLKQSLNSRTLWNLHLFIIRAWRWPHEWVYAYSSDPQKLIVEIPSLLACLTKGPVRITDRSELVHIFSIPIQQGLARLDTPTCSQRDWNSPEHPIDTLEHPIF